MAIKRIDINKQPDPRATLELVKGESRTQVVRFLIDREDGGIDLSGLQWIVRAVNAAGDSDVYMLDAPTPDDRMLTVDWIVSGVATAVAGETRFELEGVAEADGPIIWKNGTRIIKVYESLDAEPSADDEQLTALQTLILHVRNELEGVIAAGQAAGKAAADADAARERAETAEAARTEAEQARDEAEMQRSFAEEQRANAEQLRGEAVNALTIRVDNIERDKLPKSPADWDEWSAEEQAAARGRMGIHTVTQAEYDALTDTSGIYIIVED